MEMSNGKVQKTENDEENEKSANLDLLTETAVPANRKRDEVYSYKVLKTVLLYFSFFGLGLCVAVIGPSLLDLQFQTNASLQQITIVFTARSTGYLIGAMIGGACFDRFENQLLMALCVFGVGVTGIFLPWCGILWGLVALISVWGFFTGFLDTGGNVVCVNIWEKDSGPWMQALHFFFAFGATVAPLLAGPFLTPPLTNSTSTTLSPPITTILDISVYNGSLLTSLDYSVKQNDMTTPSLEIERMVSERPIQLEEYESMPGELTRRSANTNTSTESERGGLIFLYTNSSEVFIQVSTRFPATVISNVAGDYVMKESEEVQLEESDNQTYWNNTSGNSNSKPYTGNGMLWIPYTVIALYHFVLCIPFFCLFGRSSGNVRLPKKATAGDFASKTHEESRLFRVTLLIFLFVFCFAYVGHEALLGAFIYTFALKSDLGFTVQTASFLNSVFWGSFAAARALGICCAMVMTPRTMLVLDLIGLCSGSTLLAVFGSTNIIVLWTACIVLGVSMATVFPTVIAWSERYILLTGKATAVFCMAAAASEMLIPWGVGMLFDKYSHTIVMYVALALSISTTIIFVIMQVIASCHGERARDNKDNEKDENTMKMNQDADTIQLEMLKVDI